MITFFKIKGIREKRLRNKFKQLNELNVRSRDFVGKFASKVLRKCPSIRDSDFDNILEILMKPEKSEMKYDLFGNLAESEKAELEDLNSALR